MALPIFFSGCSTEKNTAVTRAYHNITTRYNVLFNAKESYKRGIKKAEQSKQDDYTQMLPLFLYGDDAVAKAVAGDMELAARKATKAVNLHSIKVKPKVSKSGMSPTEKKFYDKREFNKYMDQCYLIIGKTYVYTNQDFQALQTFNFMQTEFPGEKSLYEASLWKAKTLTLDKNYREAELLLNDLRDDKHFPDKKALKSELNASAADLYIKQKRYTEAIESLEKALTHARPKKTKLRYRYVLAQLYMEQKDYANASANFQKVIRMNPPYEMSFNATISRASASKSGGTDIHDVKKQLNKMLRDTKNKEYQDQIYYAMAEIELYEGNTDKAVELFQKSAKASTSNLPQKTKSYLTLGNLFYDRRDYIPAQAYYDSAMVNMQPDYPGYVQIASKAKNLNALVFNLNTIHFQDSVQRIARMTEADRSRLISGIISEIQRKEQAQKEAEAIRLQQYYNNMGRQNTLSDPTAKAQWYFYNPTTVSQGIGEFTVKWGRRNLEDNWRRKNKGGIADNLETAGEDDAEGSVHAAGAKKVSDIHSKEYYLQDIPLTDSMMVKSNRMVLESLYTAGYIYNNDFGEYVLAAEQYEDLIRRYPQSEYLIPSYYYLYQLYNKLGNAANAEKYKGLLLNKAPESTFAKIILDPTYLDRMAQQQNESDRLYEQAYNLYNKTEYQAVIGMATDAMNQFPKDALIPKFAFLKALSTAKLAGTPEAMRAEMRKIVTEYPGNEIAAEAQNLIDYIDGKDPVMKQAEQVERAKALYAYNEAEPYYFVWMVASKEDMNQLSFDVLNFNIDHFINSKLEVTRNNIDNSHVLLVVKSFPNLEKAQGYYRSFVMTPDMMKNVKYEHTNFLISESNYRILEQDKKVEDYIEFFKKEYLKQ